VVAGAVLLGVALSTVGLLINLFSGPRAVDLFSGLYLLVVLPLFVLVVAPADQAIATTVGVAARPHIAKACYSHLGMAAGLLVLLLWLLLSGPTRADASKAKKNQ
jgi:hypothetical protein